MTMVAVVGGAGAPGATTTALGLTLAWPLPTGRRVVMVEADPDGGAVLAGALSGRVTAEWGLHQLGLAHRQGRLMDFFFRQLIDLSDGDQHRMVLPGLASPEQAPSLTHTWEPLASLLAALDHGEIPHDVIVDLGRDGALGGSGVLAWRADVVVVVVRSTLRSISAARTRVAALRRVLAEHGAGSDALGLAVITEGPYPASEVSSALDAPVVAVLPHDIRSAQVLSDGQGEANAKFMRSPWMSAVRSSADEVLVRARTRRVRLAAPQRPSTESRQGSVRAG
jgi:hypothetical protein